jgi:hypothetical protein
MALSPLPVPPSKADPVNFSTRADAFLGALPTFQAEANALQTDVNAKQTQAATSATNAAASEAAAAATADASIWISGTTYAIGDNRFSPTNFLTYRRKTNGAGTTDPISDSTNWTLVASQGDVTLAGTQTFTGSKTFSSPIIGTLTGNASTVTNGVYTTGAQTISGVKTFNSTISGSINGNAGTVTNGVYTTGDQTITGVKTFSSSVTIGSAVSGAGGLLYTKSDDGVDRYAVGVLGSAGNKAFSVYDNVAATERMTITQAGAVLFNGTDVVFGKNRTWTDVTASRVSGTNYTNPSTSQTRVVAAYGTTTAGVYGSITVTIGGLSIIVTGDLQASTTSVGVHGIVIPPGVTYSLTFIGCTKTGWIELQ